MGSMGTTIELRLPSELGYEKLAIALAAAVAAKMGFSQDRIADLKTAVGEACTNAIVHGNRSDSRMTVLVVMTIEPDRLSVDVVDRGAAPIPQEVPAPCIARMVTGEARSGGLGMFLIRSLVDEVEISREPDGANQLRMVIHLR